MSIKTFCFVLFSMRKRKKKNNNTQKTKPKTLVPQRAKFLGNNLPKGIQQQDILLPLKIFLKKQSQIRKWFYSGDKGQHSFNPIAISTSREAKLTASLGTSVRFQN